MANKCIICCSKSNYFFSKKYQFLKYNKDLDVDYFKCDKCEFVFSKTHQNMKKDEWELLNKNFHKELEKKNNLSINQPPYLQICLVIKILTENSVIDMSRCLDYAAGSGTLSKNLRKYFDYKIETYDPYYDDKKSYSLKKYSLVINTAMFEHARSREDLDKVNNLVDQNGVLLLHTYVSENIPSNTNWFYLEPIVHCAFFTNKSMEILLKQWNYNFSIYCPDAKSWFLFKDKNFFNKVSEVINKINSDLQTNYLFFKKGFVDFWK